MFSAGLPCRERERGVKVPSTFEQLIVGETWSRKRDPGYFASSTSRQGGLTLKYDTTEVIAEPLGSGSANISFQLTGYRGATLVTGHDTFREDALGYGDFDTYTKRHYKSWVEFARNKGYGNNVRPVLVYGFDKTLKYDMMAYSRNHTSVEAGVTISVPMIGSASASIWGEFRSECTPHFKHGPGPLGPPDVRPPPTARRPPTKYNQCVFIRYFTMRWPPLPMVMRAGAGPHDLGSGENEGDTFPELAVQSDVDFDGDENREGEWDPVTDDTGSELGGVISNVPNDEGYDSWDAIAHYVFKNSNAKSVLMHHKDLAGIRAMGNESDIKYLLAMHKPRITVDKDGVGGIICGEDLLASQAATMDLPLNESLDENYNDTTGSIDASDVPPPSLTATSQYTEKIGGGDFAGIAGEVR
ncbi:hypothetical protein BJ322DRAFT_532918 [Thelephora terrestris]|uniref:Uncharacterized protein n=1 Tax=Thelephora terrestris TaxID=56493 RepID=A0A9P6LA41_9AGAM|nr:hypothetical protein BJ322DRAFT_532918 [Thelephora terrestris]